jgi:predicted dinucleotide-binding enzyme
MQIGIIGSGHIGGTLTKLLAAMGHEVAVSHSGPPETLAPLIAEAGGHARACTVPDAARFGDVVVLAIPWRNRDALPAGLLLGKIVIDAMNPYAPDGSIYDLGDRTSSEMVQEVLPGSRVVKAFNALFAHDLATLGNRDLPLEGRIVSFIAGDDDRANQTVAELVWDLGFVPLVTGGLREGGRKQQPGSPVYTKPLRLAHAAKLLGLRPAEAHQAAAELGHPD